MQLLARSLDLGTPKTLARLSATQLPTNSCCMGVRARGCVRDTGFLFLKEYLDVTINLLADLRVESTSGVDPRTTFQLVIASGAGTTISSGCCAWACRT